MTVHVGLYGITSFPGSWGLFCLIIEGVMWLVIGLIHIIYIDEFMDYVEAQVPTVCECDLPNLPALPRDATEEESAAYEAAAAERADLCAKQCPPEEAKADAEDGAEAVENEDEDEDFEDEVGDEEDEEGW